GESEKTLGQIRAAQRGLKSLTRKIGQIRLVRKALGQEIEAAYDDGEQVVEVMRHAAGELTNCLHLLRLAELGLDRLHFGLVADHRQNNIQPGNRGKAGRNLYREKPAARGLAAPLKTVRPAVVDGAV